MTQRKKTNYRMNDEVIRATNILRDHRKRLGWTPREMAKALGVGRHTIYSWENGRLAYTAVRIINFLADDLYHRDGDVAGHGAFYWRERAFAAETALRGINEFLATLSSTVKDLNGKY